MNPSTALGQVVVDELVRCGVTDAVLCPGSRNAPLSFALHAADAAGRLRLHVRLDERTAAFLALGLAQRSGRPVPVCTTSGTAVANLHPAVLEASYSGVPLVALTADRPPQLVGTGANQTIEQPGIFGRAVRHTVALTSVGADVAAEQGRWRSAVDRAVTTALSGPGPVHLNVAFAEPLVPDGPDAPPPGRPDGAPWTIAPPPARTVPPLPLDPAAPTLVIAGHGAPPLDVDAPVIAEPSAGCWPSALRTGPWLLEVDTALPRPEQVVVAGRPTLHRSVQRLLADPKIAVYAVAGTAPWPDVAGTVRAVGALPALSPPPAFTKAWQTADLRAAAALDAALHDPTAPVGLRLARTLVDALPDGALLVLGSSNPVRDVALAAVPRGGLTVCSNRGVAGIDGTVSTAIGAALAHPGPAYALIGDLTFLHDCTGLIIGPGEPSPDLTIVVLNDAGAGIFGLLEQGAPEYADAFERVFGTPHRVELDALCAATGTGYTRCEDLRELPALLTPGSGLRVVEVPADRTTRRAGHARLTKVIAQAVADLGL